MPTELSGVKGSQQLSWVAPPPSSIAQGSRQDIGSKGGEIRNGGLYLAINDRWGSGEAKINDGRAWEVIPIQKSLSRNAPIP
ncbi:hypothetical protein [Trichothermofontia sp.]